MLRPRAQRRLRPRAIRDRPRGFLTGHKAVKKSFKTRP